MNYLRLVTWPQNMLYKRNGKNSLISLRLIFFELLYKYQISSKLDETYTHTWYTISKDIDTASHLLKNVLYGFYSDGCIGIIFNLTSQFPLFGTHIINYDIMYETI